ncbi:putative spermidine/putrescine transport system substrate-binding protein [Branchiibius hedensis]|uniref:Putative spermidine/putrescine transport system substrate-binding protein n=1 Tax=Branchiibius hedensis TaxID=672460 RepID=A0A2Y8ZR20_9MICO|nr:ABC transporter substrate-binding protein [Branchiibius hedensis]PWJ25979.1 putative spermidine/putrescine transport system substrate-binding protein [Branchiibius hedensis]SSA34791.1 putative spermidine/putrescine transport system substrate-binding protein [Branchiibius hedensis]
MNIPRRSWIVAAPATISLCALALSGCASTSASGSGGTATGSGSSGVTAAKATSAADLGGMDALVKAAKAEGQLNVITLPRDWANYGTLMDDFAKKYGIKITDANPDGSSADEITAIKTLKSQPTAPDVVDVGQAFALSGTQEKLYAPYKVATWDKIPDSLKDADGNWFNDYGGYVSIGCDTARVTSCPTSLADLDKPEYKDKVALNGDPTKANAAFNAVWAAALANGGSFDNIQPGIDFFGKLKKDGVYVPVQATAATIQSGETPIVLDWDYLNAAKAEKVSTFKTVVPSDAKLPGYYAQAISAYAPHPAAARLWEEYLYSAEGQNGFLAGYARPAEMTAMTQDASIDKAAAAKLPAVDGTPTFPSQHQITKAKTTLTQNWSAAVS